jgi:hypothetical protein
MFFNVDFDFDVHVTCFLQILLLSLLVPLESTVLDSRQSSYRSISNILDNPSLGLALFRPLVNQGKPTMMGGNYDDDDIGNSGSHPLGQGISSILKLTGATIPSRWVRDSELINPFCHWLVCRVMVIDIQSYRCNSITTSVTSTFQVSLTGSFPFT